MNRHLLQCLPFLLVMLLTACQDGSPSPQREQAVYQKIRSDLDSGQVLFGQHCEQCHTLKLEKCGPKLPALLPMLPDGPWLYHYLWDTDSLVRAGDPLAREKRQMSRGFPSHRFRGRLNAQQINAIRLYLASFH